jgi:hypothetical protein
MTKVCLYFNRVDHLRRNHWDCRYAKANGTENSSTDQETRDPDPVCKFWKRVGHKRSHWNCGARVYSEHVQLIRCEITPGSMERAIDHYEM